MNPIVGIGELLWDVYPDGRKVAGGAPFNFAFHCHQLGHPAVIVSRVGNDDLGRELRDEVCHLGLSDDYIQTDREHPTGTVKVTLDENKVPTYTITENVAWDYIEWSPELERLATTRSPRSGALRSEDSASRLNSIAAVCFGTLAQRSAASRKGIAECLRRFDGSLRIFDLNLRQSEIDRDVLSHSLFRSNWLKLSEEEMLRMGRLLTEEEILRTCFGESPQAENLWIVTKGERGCFMSSPDGDFEEPAVPANVVDTVGAGDAFTAAMVCLHLEGRPLRECARFANHYAARVCEHQGATPRIDRDEVERAAFGGQ